MLIRNAEIWSGTDGRTSDIADVRLSQGHIAEIGRLVREPEESSIDARGGALLPGLHDHHIHLFARSEEHTSELQSLMRISYAVFCLKKKIHNTTTTVLHHKLESK